jgi:hypothetical protein
MAAECAERIWRDEKCIVIVGFCVADVEHLGDSGLLLSHVFWTVAALLGLFTNL